LINWPEGCELTGEGWGVKPPAKFSILRALYIFSG